MREPREGDKSSRTPCDQAQKSATLSLSNKKKREARERGKNLGKQCNRPTKDEIPQKICEHNDSDGVGIYVRAYWGGGGSRWRSESTFKKNQPPQLGIMEPTTRLNRGKNLTSTVSQQQS